MSIERLAPHGTVETYRARLIALGRGALGRCPNCGKGALLHRYLKISPRCPSCGEDYSGISADDMPPWLTILVVGHLLVPNVWYVQQNFDIPMWVEQVLWPSLAVILMVILLPRCKGFCVALLWLIPRLPQAQRPHG